MRPVLTLVSRVRCLRSAATRVQLPTRVFRVATASFLILFALINSRSYIYKETIVQYRDPGEWCAPQDKAATGWSDQLSDAECGNRLVDAQRSAIARVRNGTGTVLFKHVHKAGGTTMCRLATQNMITEDVQLPFREDWSTNCVPYESFLGPHPAVGSDDISMRASLSFRQRKLQGAWLGGACFLGFLTPAQLRVLPTHYLPLNFVASEGPLPDSLPLDITFAMVTMLRNPVDRVLSSFRWFQYMTQAMPHSPTECHAYQAPANATLQEWLHMYPDNWMTRELAGTKVLFRRDAHGFPAPLTSEDLATAKQRLRMFSAVLIMERWDSSMKLMEQLFHWKDVDYIGHRAGSRRDTAAEVELVGQPEVLKILRDRNRMDIDLYQYALQMHEDQIRGLKNV